MKTSDCMRWLRHPVRALLLAAWTALAAGTPAAADDLKDGRSALQAGRFDQALQSFEKAAQQGLAAGRAGVGQVHLRRRQLDKAMEAFQTAQKMDPTLALAHWGQGEVLRRRNQCEQAIPLFRKATELDRKFPEAQQSLGECLVQVKQIDAAIAAFNEGVKWGPKIAPRFLVGLGTAEEARDSLRDAGIYFTRAREQAPNDPQVRRALGDFYTRRGTWALAILEYQASAGMDSTDVELRYLIAQALYFDKRYDEALTEYQYVVERDGEYAPGQLGLGNLLYLAGIADRKRYAEARAPLEKYTQIEPNDPKGWSLLGRTYYNLQMKDEAVAAMLKAESLGDKSKEMYNYLGKAYADRKEWAKALESFGRGDPGTKEKLIIGQVHVFQNDIARAESVYTAVVTDDSTTGDARFAMNELGKLRFRQAAMAGRDSTAARAAYQAAIGIFQRRIALDPNNGDAYYYMGLSHKEMKQYPEALVALERAAQLDSTKADRFFWLGVLYDAQKRQNEARSAFQRSVQLDSTSKTAGKAYRQLGFYLLLDKNWNRAIEMLEQAVRLDERDVQAWVWLGQGYQNAGNRAKAIESYRRALEFDPNQPEASKGLKILSGGASSAAKGGSE